MVRNLRAGRLGDLPRNSSLSSMIPARDRCSRDIVTAVALDMERETAILAVEDDMEITRGGSQPTRTGPADYFTGTVQFTP